MPSYTTADRVRTLCKRLPAFSAGSTITTTEVESLIDGHEAEINVALAHHGYATPVTSPAALLTWLGKIATEGTAAAVLKSLFQEGTGQNSESAWSVWEKRYQEALKAIRADDMVPAATDISGGRGITSFTTDVAEDELGDGGDADGYFSRAMEW